MSSLTRQKWGRSVPICDYRGRDSVAQIFARARGYKNEATAHQRLQRLPEEIADAIRAHVDRPDRFARWWAPVAIELACARLSTDTKETLRALSEADAAEDVSRQDWILNPQDTKAIERDLERQAEWSLRMLALLRAKRRH